MPALTAVLFLGILTLWVEDRWALSAFQIAIFSLAAVRIILRIRGALRIVVHPVAGLLAAASAWGLIQIAAGRSIDAQKTGEAVLDWFVNCVVFCLAFELTSNSGNRRWFLRAILVFACVLSVVSLFTALTSPAGTVFWRFSTSSELPTLGPFVYRNQYAAFVESILPLVIAYALRDQQRWLLYALIVAVLFGSVIEGGSRAGSTLCLAELLVVPLLAYSRGMIAGRVLTRTLAGIVIAVTLFTASVGWESIWNRFQEPNLFATRLHFVQSSIAMIRARPVIGFGLGTWANAYPAYALFDDGKFANQAHNDWVQWAAEGGIPFLLLLLAVVGYTIRPALRSLWGMGLLAVYLHSLIDYPMQQRPALTAFFFALLGALLASDAGDSLLREREERTQKV